MSQLDGVDWRVDYIISSSQLKVIFLGFITLFEKMVCNTEPEPGPEVIKLLFMLSSAETKIYPAHKC